MIKNKACCLNCEYYHPCLGEADSFYHLHDFCGVWEISNPYLYKHPLNSFLETHYLDVEEANGVFCVWDDVECGLASCYMFKKADDNKLEVSDGGLDNRLLENINKAIKTINYILDNQKIHDLFTHRKRKVNERDIEELTSLKERFENMYLQTYNCI